MFLKDLAIHAPAQEKAISQLLNEPPLCGLGPDLSAWSRFRESVWKKSSPSGVEPFERKQRIFRGRNAVRDIQLPPTRSVVVSPETLPNVWGLPKREILARSEYYEAEATALSHNRKGYSAFAVSGQPGIGKSIFLLWLLLRRLALGLPTALQVHSEYAILFHESGVSKFAFLNNPIVYQVLSPPPLNDPEEMQGDPEQMKEVPEQLEEDEPIDRDRGRIWALVDTNPLLEEHAGIFKHPGTFFVVVNSTSSPDYLRWLKKVSHRKFYMRPWSLSEILQARPFVANRSQGPHSEYELQHLHNEFGVSSPRELAAYASAPDDYEALIIEGVMGINPSHLQRIFISPHLDDSSHLVLVVGPSLGRRDMLEKRIASRRVFEILWEIHLKYRTSDMAYCYDLFRASSTSARGAGWVFELRMHQLLRRRQTIRLFPIIQTNPGSANFIYKSYTRENPMDLWLPGSDQYPLSEGAGSLVGNRYHRLEAAKFPTISSLLLVQPPGGLPFILLMFRIIQDPGEYDVNEEDLRRTDGLHLPPATRKYYVVVTPREIEPTINVPREYSGGGSGTAPLSDGLFQVFNHPVPMHTLFRDD